MAALLYLDKDEDRRRRVIEGLASSGLSADTATTIDEAKRMLACGPHECVLLHHEVAPAHEVLRFCSFARAWHRVQVIVVIMNSVCIQSEGRLFDSGVDDVVTGPHACTELIAKRIRARLCGKERAGSSRAKVKLGNTVVDFGRQEVWRNGQRHSLPGILSDLLWYLVHNADHVVSRQELNASPIWANSICTPAQEGGKTFDVHISRLRKIVEDDPKQPVLIRSVRGIGWRLGVEPACGSEAPDDLAPEASSGRSAKLGQRQAKRCLGVRETVRGSLRPDGAA